MRKQLRLLAIIGVAVLVLGVALGVLLLTQPEESEESSAVEESSDTSVELLKVEREETSSEESSKEEETASLVKEAVVTYDGETYTIRQDENGQLCVKGYEKLPVGTTNLESFEEAVTAITAIQPITGTGNDADYGLDKPTATAVITYYDGTKVTLTLGNAAPQNVGYYFRISSVDGIYLVSSDLASQLMQASTMYIGTTLMVDPEVKEDDENGQAVLRDVTLKGPGVDREYSYRLVADSDGSEFAYTTYVLTYPYMRATNSNTLGESILTATSVYATAAVVPFPTDAQLEKYGLDTPHITATINTAVQTSTTTEASNEDEEDVTVTSYYNVQPHTFRLSEAKDGMFYVLFDDVDCIYQIATTALPWATLSYEDCVTSLMFLKDITTVSKMSFTYNGKTTAFALTHYPEEEDNEKNLVVTMDGKTIPTDYFRSFYQILMGVERGGVAPAKPTGKPVISFDYTDKDTGVTTTIELFEHSASVYIGRFDGGDIFKIRASEVDTLLRQYQNLLDGKEVLLG